MKQAEFLNQLWVYYDAHQRDLPWRQSEPDGSFDPYKILVSELMLQQTQVNRVIPKYQAFMQAFPGVEQLARAELGEVLVVWSGLGYNRRAKFLHQAAQTIVEQTTFPTTLNMLTKLPGVGVNTAGAIMAYAYNQPVVFIETNVRTVYIHHFFADESVADTDLTPVIEASLAANQRDPRGFYWALMDYGTHLKQTVGNVSRRSKHYTKQSTFNGSLRQIRGQVLKQLAMSNKTKRQLAIADDRLPQVLEQLAKEGLITKHGQTFKLG